ncbi:PREDICTED: uncharacterized protein LOC108764979 [Trachymyrmex cornetzi]|uniref:Uncharacterized protein n=1 Tax=Trachymyrmex cornetzi TaxID=471704 RepID=A0A195DR72_9HYME|nr:PREDICTED: uncharacterized protein LOC108764979 [Trachymyrmex cornetzi]KYN15368.1 hypothetical protein ALC57_12417 [Trachymyrmex cornetzi]
MISKFIFVWCLSYLYFKAHAEHFSQYFQESSDNTQCIFDVPRKIYNVTDLLRCMDELAIGLFAQNRDQSLIVGRASQTDSSDYEENSYGFPYGNIISNLLNIVQVPSEYNNYVPLDSNIGNYQLNTLINPLNQFGSLGANIFNAMSSISRYDDLKCVPRILCEVASGNSPGEYKQALTENNEQYLGESGRNIFTQWLTGLAQASPILSFARATVLGYNSNGNPAMCYRAFPRCPRNPDKLLHYLNNHNGGFFQFFNRGGHERYSQSSYALQDTDNSELREERRWNAPPPNIARAEADRTGTGKLKFDFPVLTNQNRGKSFFPRENTLENSGRVVFPDYEGSSGRPLKNRISKSLSDLRDFDVNTFSRDSPLVFPQESKAQVVHVLRFIPESPDSISHNTFRFPH